MKDDSPPPPYAEFDSNLLNHDLNPRKQHLPSAPPSPDYPEHVLYPRGLLETPNNHYQASLRPQNQPETTQNRGSTIFGPLPTKIVCPYCEVAIVTKTKYVPGKLVWLIMLGCAILGIWLIVPWFLCCIPCCVPSCLDVIHKCPFCKRRVGEFCRL